MGTVSNSTGEGVCAEMIPKAHSMIRWDVPSRIGQISEHTYNKFLGVFSGGVDLCYGSAFFPFL